MYLSTNVYLQLPVKLVHNNDQLAKDHKEFKKYMRVKQIRHTVKMSAKLKHMAFLNKKIWHIFIKIWINNNNIGGGDKG